MSFSCISSEMAGKINNEIEEERITSDSSKATEKYETITIDNIKNNTFSESENHRNLDNSAVMNIKITNITSLSPKVFANVPDVKSSGNHKLLESNTSLSRNFSNSEDFQTKNTRLSFSKCQSNYAEISSKRKHETNICVIGTHVNRIKTVVIDKSKRVKVNDLEENMKASCSVISYNGAKLQNNNPINIESSQKSVKNRSIYKNQEIFESSNYRKNKIFHKNSTTNIFPSKPQLTKHNISESQINKTSLLISGQSTSEDVIITNARNSNTYQSLNTEKHFTSRKMTPSPNSDSLGIKDGIQSILRQVSI